MAERTVLIVGAGFGQVPAIETARHLGWRAVVIDRNPDAPGMRLADTSHVVDVVDRTAALDVARSEAVDGVLTLQSDIGVPTVGIINQELGLTGVDLETAVRCSDKDLTRTRWAEAGVPQPAFRIVRTADEAAAAASALGYPVVAKAADASGSRGIVKVDAPADVAAAFDAAIAASRKGAVVMEQYVPGLEVGAQTFSAGGRCETVLLHNDQVSPPPFMIPVGHSYPFRGDGVDTTGIEDAIRSAVETLGIRNGPANVDLFITPEGKPMLLEVGARIGATCLPELTSLYTGIDWVEAALRSCTGDDVLPQPTRARPCAARILEADRDGTYLTHELPDWIDEDPDVLEVEVTVRPGEPVSRLRKGTDRIGKVVTSGPNAERAEALAAKVSESIRIDIR